MIKGKDVKITNLKELIIYFVRYRTKEFLFFVILLLVAWILTMNVYYEDGKLQWRPAAKIDVKIQKSIDGDSSTVQPIVPNRSSAPVPDPVKKPENAVSIP